MNTKFSLLSSLALFARHKNGESVAALYHKFIFHVRLSIAGFINTKHVLTLLFSEEYADDSSGRFGNPLPLRLYSNSANNLYFDT